ncbi:MAG: LTA synthase family protein [Clostridia bacterium]|nr:LTA synthase family protein [Clostridia bacterium]
MQATENEKRWNLLFFFVETVLPFMLLCGKLWRLNGDMLGLGKYILPMTAFTVVIFAAVCLFVRVGMKKNHVPVFMGLYFALSALMLVDSVYCGYTGKLPSVVMLQYVWQLGDVIEAIYENVTPARLLYAIDVPFWIVYFVHLRPKLTRWFPRGKENRAQRRSSAPDKRTTGFCGILGGIAAVLCVGYCLFTPFIPSYFGSEILSYHILDVRNTLFSKEIEMPSLSVLTGEETTSSSPDGDSVPVSAETSPYYSIAAGRNVITIQVEALQNFVIGAFYNGQEITPNLNALIAGDTLYYDNYYYQIGGGNTADAEFAVNNSLYAPDTEAAYSKYYDNDYYSMATLLKDNGYSSATAFHGYIGNYWYRDIAYPGQGFDTYLSGSDYYAAPDEVAGMGVSDGEFFLRAAEYLSGVAGESDAPFYAFLITLSSHYAFDLDDRFDFLTLDPEDEGTLYGDYLQAIHYTDAAIGMFVEALKAYGLYDNSIITIYGDHFGLPVYKWECKAFLTEFLDHEYTYADHFNVPLIMHIPGADINETVSVAGGHIDVMPTLLHLLGLENNKGIMFGQNLLTATEGIVYQQTHLARGSFISDTVLYQYPFTGIAPNAKANAVDTWEELDASLFADVSAAAREEIELCMYLLEHDLVLVEKYVAAEGN